MPNDDKWAQYVETPSTDRWEQYAQPAESTSSPTSLVEQGRKSYAAKGGQVGMPGSFEGHPENVGEYVPQTVGNVASGVGDIAQGNIARGAHEILTGGMNTLLPAAPFVAAGAPGAFALGTAGSYLGGKVGRGAATIFGRTPDQQDLAEDIGSLVGGATPFAKVPARKVVLNASGEPRIPVKMLVGKDRAGMLADFLRPPPTPEPTPPSPFAGATPTNAPIGSAELPPVPKGNPTPFPPVQKLTDIRAAQRAAAAAARKSAMPPPPPSPFGGMTSTAAPIGNAPLPEVPQGTPTPFPTVQPKAKVASGPAAAVESGAGPTGTSLLSRGRTLVTPGLEPDLNNPVHVKMINDYQTMSGPALRQLASAGDRFAAFVLRHMPRPQ